ncbi:pseudouridine synthase [Burkholderia alba]|uniref:pseudouridine synthase n=1 Tax=Burkholderia alba TaxID=2683677 RepID=UPI002B0593AF|nr:pseudouridine synthase [Burkholderia alba]
MRTKLTVKNPQPASPSRAPVRSGSLTGRKPTRPAEPAAGSKPAGAKKAFAQKAGTGTSRPGADRAPAKRPARDGGDAKSAGRGERGEGRPFRSADGKPTPRGERGEGRSFRSADGKPAPRGERSEGRPFRSTDGKPAPRGERSEGRPFRSADGKPAPRGDRGEGRPFRSADGKPAPRGERSEGRPFRSADGKPAPRGERSEGRPFRSTDGKPAPRGERSEGRPFRSADGKPAPRGERSEGRPFRSADGKPAPRGDRSDSRPYRSTESSSAGDRTGRDDEARPRRAGVSAEGGKRAPYRGETAGAGGAKRSFGERPARGAGASDKRPSANAGFKTAQPVKRRAPDVDHGDETGLLRLSKRMSELGLCSRREADEWIEKGWVLVDGERIDTLGTKVRPDQHIEIDANARAEQAAQVTILLHKPVGYVSGQAEDGYQPAATLITRDNHWSGDRSAQRFSPHHLRALAPAGRLDIDSTGLLVLTQNGRVAKQLIGEQSDIDKEYLVRVRFGERLTEIDQHFPAEALAQLRHGLELDGAPLKPAMVSWQNGEQLRFVLREGKKRQIRRMCELVGLEVIGLKRVRMGHVMLGALPQGQWRYLSADESF